MARVKSKNTAPELRVRRALKALGVSFRLQARDLVGKPDIVNRKRWIAIFVHGCFWHGHSCKRGAQPTTNTAFWKEKLSKNKTRDRAATRDLRRKGWNVLIIWECQTKDENKLSKRLTNFIQHIEA